MAKKKNKYGEIQGLRNNYNLKTTNPREKRPQIAFPSSPAVLWSVFWTALLMLSLILFLGKETVGVLFAADLSFLMAAAGIICSLVATVRPDFGYGGWYRGYAELYQFPRMQAEKQENGNGRVGYTRFPRFLVGILVVVLVILLISGAVLSGMGLFTDVTILSHPNRVMGTVTESLYENPKQIHKGGGGIYGTDTIEYGHVRYKITFDEQTAGETSYVYEGYNMQTSVKQKGSRQLVLFHTIDSVHDIDLWKLEKSHSAMLLLTILGLIPAILGNRLLYPLRYRLDQLDIMV